MEEVLISGLLTLLQEPRLIPDDMEHYCQKLLILLTCIRPMLGDAKHRSGNDVMVRSWLNDLRKVSYQADDILDGLRYVKLHTGAYQFQNDKLSTGLLSCYKIISMKLPFLKRWVSGGKQGLGTVVNRFGDLAEIMTAFNFQEGQRIIAANEREAQLRYSSAARIGLFVVGRDEIKENIVRFLLDPSNTVHEAIVETLIVGDGGIGKRTLAQFVCEDDRINEHFECILWVDVVSDFSIGKIAKSIIDQAIRKNCCLSEEDTYLLKRRIYQELSGKRYLLVYNNDGGDEQLLVELKSWLERGGGSGSSLIVLTSYIPAQNLCSSAHLCELPPLMVEDLWILFSEKVFPYGYDGVYSKIFKSMGLKIVHKCIGSPLLVNLMGGLLRFKEKPEEWQEVINQLENLDYPENFSILKLCYDYISSETKQCFLFCSLFPLGYYMDKDVLIKLWMANGLLSSDGSTSMEKKGDSIFRELALRHFFEEVKLAQGDEELYMNNQEYYSKVLCKMTRIIYDFCQVVAFDENIYQLDERNKYKHCRDVCYLSTGGESPIDFNVVLKNYPLVRTLISTADPFVRTVKCSGLPKSNSLRALKLRSSIFEGDFLKVVEHMKHLRYLDLSGSRIKILPESTCSLYNLQTLNLSKCLLLYQLPENMSYMRSLRHLYVHKCPKLNRMPPHLSKLIYLKTLSVYIVGEQTGNGIDEIKYLDLGDLLELYNLYNVKDAEKAKDANLASKWNLRILTLCWGSNRLVMPNKSNDLEVLEALEPHRGINVLKVRQYGDPKFASWLVGLRNLVELHLIGCPQFQTLPAVWRLSSLQVLFLKHMASLTCICSFPSVDNKDSLKLFPSLNRMVLVNLKRLERWWQEEASLLELPKLDEIEIIKCPNLKTMPHVPNLKHFKRSIENHRQLWSVIALVSQSKSLLEVSITKGSSDDNEPLLSFVVDKWDDNHKLRILRLDSTNIFFMPRAVPQSLLGFWQSLVSLENLDICNCNSLVDWPLEEFKNLNKLKRLSFRMCLNLTGLFPNQLLEGEELLPRLQTLEFYRCISLKEVPKCCSIRDLELDECPKVETISGIINLENLYLSCTSWTSLPAGLGDLKKLESLRVSECYSLTFLPDELAGLTSLRTFIINKCPRVKSIPNCLNQTLSGLEKFQTLECPDLEKSCRDGPYFFHNVTNWH